MSVAVRAVASRRERTLFRDLPAELHGRDPAFIPMLDAALKAVLDRKRNPFWEQAAGCEWLAWRGADVVGRIGACRDESLAARETGLGAVGFFDGHDDPEVARALFATAEGWLAEKGCRRARGPLNYSIHDTAGVLVEGFDTPPTVDTTWNPAWYGPLWEAAGWREASDLLGLAGLLEHGGPGRAQRFAERAKRQGVTVRPLDMRRFAEEVESVRRVYNEAWDENWGHVPIRATEFAFKAKDLRAVLDADIVRIAEADGQVVGFLLALPDLNEAIRRSRGRLLPWGWWRLLRARHRTDRARVVALGVLAGYRLRGVEALLLIDSFQAMGTRYRWAEASWVLADNAALLNGLALYNLKPYKRWRLYEKDL